MIGPFKFVRGKFYCILIMSQGFNGRSRGLSRRDSDSECDSDKDRDSETHVRIRFLSFTEMTSDVKLTIENQVAKNGAKWCKIVQNKILAALCTSLHDALNLKPFSQVDSS